MYAIIITFDNNTQNFIKSIWKDLRDNDLSNYGFEIMDREPHLTLASFSENCRESELINRFEKYNLPNGFPINFVSIGSFCKTHILFLSPLYSQQLIYLHNNVAKFFSNYIDVNSVYSIENWVPHLTIANRIASNKIKELFSYCLNKIINLKSQITEMKLIKINPNGDVTILKTKYF